MAKKIKVKIPKLKKEDRIKIIDRPDLLLVHPLTHNASIRYGHKSNWCTSTGNKKTFTDHIKNEVLLYCIIYKVDDNSKRISEKTKLAISKPKRTYNYRNVACYDRFDARFSLELLEALLNPSDFLVLTDYLKIKKETIIPKKVKQQTSEFKVGDFVSCIGNKRLKLNYHEYDDLGWAKYLKKQTNRWRKTQYYKRSKFTLFNFSFYIKKQDIKKAEVIKVNSNSIEIKPIIIDGLDKLKMSLIDEKEIIIKLNMTINPEIKLVET